MRTRFRSSVVRHHPSLAALARRPPRQQFANLRPLLTRAHDIAGTGPHYDDERLFRIVDAIDVVAQETGKTVPQIALNWLLQRPTVSTVVIGARNEEQLKQNLGAVGWNLTKDQVAKLDKASEVPLIYPYWHQRGFAERNPPPV